MKVEEYQVLTCKHYIVVFLCPQRHVRMKTGTVLQKYQPSSQGVLGLQCSEFYDKT
jgi:hypothetical protein